MKNLRHLLRRSGLLRSETRRGRPEKDSRNNVSRRQLSNEALERRELLAGDVLASGHNYWNSYDVNDDLQITARDALAIINRLNAEETGVQPGAAGSLLASGNGGNMFYDVNADHSVTAADALGVINALGRAEGVGELTELLLNARDINDDLITPEADGSISLGVNEPFYLEVSYNELRLFNDRLGVFQIYADLGFSEANALEPILNETQRLIIGGDSLSRDDLSEFTGDFVFSMPDGTTYESPFLTFAQNSRGEVVNALSTFGYSSDQYDLSSLDFGNDDIGFQIFFKDAAFRDSDLPNISVSSTVVDGSNNPVDFPTQSIEFAPRNPDGTINSDAVRFNVDSFSRTFNDNEKFYSSQNRGGFDPATGFTSYGGLGLVPPQGGGIPQLTDDGGFITPFDAVSVLVKFTKPVSNFMVDVNPGEGDEDLLLYGRDEAVPQDKILIDEDATVTFNVTASPEPPAAGDTTLSVTEDITQTLDLSSLLSGGTPDSLTVTTNGSRGSASIDFASSTLTYIPTMDENGSDSIVYTASNEFGSDTGTITIDIAAVNDPPVAEAKSFSTTQDEALTIQLSELLANASTGAFNENDTLTVTAVSDPAEAGAMTALNGVVTYTPASGFTGNDSFTYTISDGEFEDTATVSIGVGVRPAPVAGDTTLNVTEDIDATLDLSTLLSGGLFETLTVISPAPTRGGASISGTTLTYDPTLNENGSDTIIYRATNNGGSDDGTITVNITPVNDAPVPAAKSFDAIPGRTLTIELNDLLSGASTGAANENDTLTVSAVGTPTENGSMTTLNGVVTYTSDPGFEGTDTFTYTIDDGNANNNLGTATVTITVAEVAPVAGDANLAVPEAGSRTLDLATLIGVGGGFADSYTIVSNDTGIGSGQIIDGSVLSYSPNVGVSSGTDTLVYQATNSAGSDTGTITISITDVNQMPVVGDPISVSFSEELGVQSVDLLQNTSDPDGDSLLISNFTLASGNGVGVTAPGANDTNASVDPDASGFLLDSESAVSVYTYDVTDGEFSVPHRLTITINGFNDPPTANDDPNLIAFLNVPADFDVIANDNAGDGESGQSFSVISATPNDANGTVSVNGDGTVRFTPAQDYTGPSSFTYTIEDSQGKRDTATASVTVQDFNPSNIGGAIFIDHIENITDVISGEADPIRNGRMDSDESGVGGMHVMLHSDANDNLTGETISEVALTSLHGTYGFDNLAPGTYTVTPMIDGLPFDQSEKIVYLGPGEFQIMIGVEGGINVTNADFPVLATSGNALQNVDILASSFLRNNSDAMDSSNGGREGGVASIDSSGEQNFIIVNEGFEGIEFAELVLNESHDSALLTILEDDGDLLSARLTVDEDFVVSNGNGMGVQFFGGVDDFDFFSRDGSMSEEFPSIGNAIDEFLGDE